MPSWTLPRSGPEIPDGFAPRHQNLDGTIVTYAAGRGRRGRRPRPGTRFVDAYDTEGVPAHGRLNAPLGIALRRTPSAASADLLVGNFVTADQRHKLRPNSNKKATPRGSCAAPEADQIDGL
jgi:hypothetical protein